MRKKILPIKSMEKRNGRKDNQDNDDDSHGLMGIFDAANDDILMTFFIFFKFYFHRLYGWKEIKPDRVIRARKRERERKWKEFGRKLDYRFQSKTKTTQTAKQTMQIANGKNLNILYKFQ